MAGLVLLFGVAFDLPLCLGSGIVGTGKVVRMGGWAVMQVRVSQLLEYANKAGFWSKDLHFPNCKGRNPFVVPPHILAVTGWLQVTLAGKAQRRDLNIF